MLTIPMLQERRAAAGTSIKVHVMYMIGLKLCELVHRIYISDAICCITHQVHRPKHCTGGLRLTSKAFLFDIKSRDKSTINRSRIMSNNAERQ